MKVRVSNEARADLQEIVDYIARDNPLAARRVRHAIRTRIATLSDHPSRGRAVETEGSVALRRIVEGPYLIFYLIGPQIVLITRILRGSRDIATELRRKPSRLESD